MSMPTHDAPPRARAPSTRPRAGQPGFGLVQVMLVLLLVGSALAAGALLLQSKRPTQQAVTQEQTLRWADDAVAAFAASHARLPCPSATVHGEEDCVGLRSRGWLPLRTLLGASGTAPQIGPVAYMVYRGDETSHLDLTAPGNAYRPPGLDGNPREIADDEDDPDATREFAAINTLDFCLALGLAEGRPSDGQLANTRPRSGAAVNVAYGVAAAGPSPGTGAARFDGDNASGATASMEAPWREWDQGYDDRVRVRGFDGLAQAVGCRLLADSAAGTSPRDVSIAAIDVLAAAVTVHDTLAALQENNIGNTEASVVDAGFAQAASIAAVLLSVGQVTDSVSSMITSATSLVRAVATCIASLGATCWEVPLKATALGLSIGSVASNAVALGLNIGALVPTAQALSKTIDARDRAKKAAEEKPRDLQSAIDELACSLYGIDPPDLGYNPCTPKTARIPRLDADGYPIPRLDGSGQQIFENGVPAYEYDEVIVTDPQGMDEQRDDAHAQWQALRVHSDRLFTERIVPWSDARLRDRIDEGLSWEVHGKRYQKKRYECRHVGPGGGEYDASCLHVGRDAENKPRGDHERVEIIEFDWTLAIDDTRYKRQRAELWVGHNRRAQEIDRELEELRDSYDQWFNGSDPIIERMRRERNTHCALPQSDPVNRDKCEAAKDGVTYIETCMKSSGALDGGGQRERVLDPDPLATCRPRMQERLASVEAEKSAAIAGREAAASQYRNHPGPVLRYPSEWPYWAMLEEEDADGNVTYRWVQSNTSYSYWETVVIDDDGNTEQRERRMPFYAPEPYPNGPWSNSSAEMLVTGNLQLRSKDNCNIWHWIWGWDRAWFGGARQREGLYCQRHPYSRAFDDWNRAQDASDLAEQNYEDLADQFDDMLAEYTTLRNTQLDGPGGANSSPVSFGAESALERADFRGAVGPQPAPAGSP